MKEKVVIGLSGGVDSAVAAYLLKEQGYDVVGVTMQIWEKEPKEDNQAIRDAKAVAQTLGIPHYVINFYDIFEEKVICNFTEEYLNGRTPNPCVICNRYVKWEALMKWGKEMGADYVATGHYARVGRLENGRYAICSAATAAKDQTYALYNLSQDQLAHTIMPLGEYTKDEVREIARRLELPVAKKKDSMEICFVPDDDYASYIENYTGKKIPEGNYVDKAGNVLGRHKGIIHYTIGQRKGLGLAMGRHVFVTGIRPETNEVVIGDSEDLFDRTVLAQKVNYMGMESFKESVRAMAKIRYNHKGDMCTVSEDENGCIVCVFDEPVRAATPGQSLVIYKDGAVLGGGIIC